MTSISCTLQANSCSSHPIPTAGLSFRTTSGPRWLQGLHYGLYVCLFSGLLHVLFIHWGILDAILHYRLQVLPSHNVPRLMQRCKGVDSKAI